MRFVPLPWIGVPEGGGGGDADGTQVEETFDGRMVAALGRLEPADGIVAVGALPGDLLKTLDVHVGDTPTKDDVIGRLASYELRQLEVESVDAQLKEAHARETAETNLADSRIIAARLALEQAKAKSLELDSQEQQVNVLSKKLELEQHKLDAIQGVSRDLISEEEQQQQDLLVQKLKAELSAAQSTVTQLQKTSKLAIDAAQADFNAAETAKQQIKSTIPTDSLEVARKVAVEQQARAEIKAPITGTVLTINMQEGEHVTNQPILQMANLKKMVCIAEVYETDVRRVHQDQRAVIRSKAFRPEVNKKGLHGTVRHVGDIVGPAQLNPLDPFARTDRRVVEVRIELDPGDVAVAARYVNLQVDVTIDTGQGAEQVAAGRTPR
jgi:HlyD family secretion protein